MRLCVALHKPTDFSAKSSASNIRVHKLSTMIIKVSDLPVTLVHLHQAKGLHILWDNYRQSNKKSHIEQTTAAK